MSKESEGYYSDFREALNEIDTGIKKASKVYVEALSFDKTLRSKFKTKFKINFSDLDRLEKIGKEISHYKTFFISDLNCVNLLSKLDISDQSILLTDEIKVFHCTGVNEFDFHLKMFVDLRKDQQLMIIDKKSLMIRSEEQQKEYIISLMKKGAIKQISPSKALPPSQVIKMARLSNIKPKHLAEMAKTPNDLLDAYEIAIKNN